MTIFHFGQPSVRNLTKTDNCVILYMKNISDLYKYLKITNRFEGSHNISTPRSVVRKILDKINTKDKKIFVLFNVEFVIELIYTHNVDPANILFYSDHENKTKFVNRMSVNATTSLEQKMKFDVCLMNAPYTQGAKLLYAHFFEKALTLADTVVSVMPMDLESGHDKLKFHNQRIEKHNSFISENISEHFNVGLNNIHYVIASEKINNPIKPKVNKLTAIPLLYPTRTRLKFIAGDTDCGKSQEFPNGTDVVYAVLKDDKLITKKIDSTIASKSCRWTKANYSVFVNYTPSNGFLNCVIIPNCNMTWTRKVFMIECDTLDEANKTKAWLQSSEIQNEILKMFRAKSETYYTLSLEMANRLPHYE